jgi:hypothetical protein
MSRLSPDRVEVESDVIIATLIWVIDSSLVDIEALRGLCSELKEKCNTFQHQYVESPSKEGAYNDRSVAAMTPPYTTSEDTLDTAGHADFYSVRRQLPSGSTDGAKEAAAATFSKLVVDAEDMTSVAAAGVIPLLVQLLKDGTEEAKVYAATALRSMVVEAGNRATCAATGAIPLLVMMLTAGTDDAKEAAAGALLDLAVDANNGKIIATAGAIPLLVQLLRGGTEDAKEAAAGTLISLLEQVTRPRSQQQELSHCLCRS